MKPAQADEASPGLRKFIDYLAGKLVLDAPCGFGRNSFALAEAGCSVVAVDHDVGRLKTLEKQKASRQFSGHILSLCADLDPENWCLFPDSFDAIICVHYDFRAILRHLLAAVRPGGYIYFETFGGQGRNYLELPPRGFLTNVLRDNFEIKFCRERKVGPAEIDSVAVNAFARKVAAERVPVSKS